MLPASLRELAAIGTMTNEARLETCTLIGEHGPGLDAAPPLVHRNDIVSLITCTRLTIRDARPTNHVCSLSARTAGLQSWAMIRLGTPAAAVRLEQRPHSKRSVRVGTHLPSALEKPLGQEFSARHSWPNSTARYVKPLVGPVAQPARTRSRRCN